MQDAGYDTETAAAVTAASATIGPIIPPSLPMIIYGVSAETSIGNLFLGGVIPGLLMALALMVIVRALAIRKNLPSAPIPGIVEIREAFVGALPALSGVKYVITLDTDTELPRDAARQFVGTMAHPLNRPVYDERKGRVVAGYGILQPRVGISLPGASRSRYTRLYGGEPGIDPYTRAVSDVYQDVFGEGSFIGKGIYDVEAFERALGGQIGRAHV